MTRILASRYDAPHNDSPRSMEGRRDVLKAAVLSQFNKPLSIEEVPVPPLDRGSVLVKVEACGLCGTDLKIAAGLMPGARVPLIPGHEVAGTVLEVGEGATNVAPGDRVVVYFYVTCGQCLACRRGWDTLCSSPVGQIGFNINGGCAEIVKVPAGNVFHIPPGVPFEGAALLADAVATTYHALLKRANAQKGQTAVLIGMGGLGLHAVQLAKVIGMYTVAVDIDEAHLAAAARFGTDVLINSSEENLVERILDLTGGKGAEIVLELSGNPAAAASGVSLLAPRGRMVIVGYHPTEAFEASSTVIASKELEIYGSRASTKQDLAAVIDLVGAGKIEPVVHQVMPLSAINKAYRKLKSGEVLGRLVLLP